MKLYQTPSEFASLNSYMICNAENEWLAADGKTTANYQQRRGEERVFVSSI